MEESESLNESNPRIQTVVAKYENAGSSKFGPIIEVMLVDASQSVIMSECQSVIMSECHNVRVS